MPNAERVALCLAEAVVGLQVWNGLTGECATMPDEDYERTRLASIAMLEQLARIIDWPRLLSEAEQRHRDLHPDTRPEPKNGYGWALTHDVCGPCLHEALLAHGFPGHCQDWKNQPDVVRRGEGIDWAAVFAETIAYRRPGYGRLNTKIQTTTGGAR